MVGLDRAGVGAGLPTFVAAESFAAGGACILDEHAARHMRVLRLDAGAIVGLRDGRGAVGEGQLVRLTKSQAHIEVTRAEFVEPPPPLHMLVPVADRDRMFWLAEKAGELACTSWRPVLWRRSRSVSPRGEGRSFQAKMRARMEHALAQSEGAWLPQIFPEANLERALLAAPEGARFILDPDAAPLTDAARGAPPAAMVIAVGPEGGIEPDEFATMVAAGFTPASLGPTILRFETAGVVAMGIARTLLVPRDAGPPTTEQT